MFATLAAVDLGGCDKAMNAVNEVQQTVTNRVEEVKQVAAVAGNIQLQVDNKSIQTTGCYGTTYRLETPLQSVIQVTSYNDPSAESFPSFFARAFVADVADIAPGKQLEAQVYLQENPNGSVWETPPGEPAELKITSVANGVFEAEIAGAMANSDDGVRKNVSGTLSGSLGPSAGK